MAPEVNSAPQTPMSQNDTAVVKGTRWGLLSTLFSFVAGLAVTVWSVPGVPTAIFNYLTLNLPGLLLAFGIGIPFGIVVLLINFARKDVRNF